ncbi:MAG: hypothetical protein M1821_008002 [Bathelium mastoideum]|nr:MAG: hypothetical protein M1821_008002 [Bathelium mastoideum]
MASTDKQEPSTEEQTFTKMAAADVDAIGAHCEMPFCRQLDFLPFRCESCKGKFCLDHRTESAHSCSHAGEWARRQRQAQLSSSSSSSSTPKPSILTHEQQCSSPSCKTLINTPLTQGVHCPNCNRSYCLKHRMREDHNCANLVPLGARPGGVSQREKGLAALEKLRAWGAAKQKSLGASMPKVSAPSSLSSSAKGGASPAAQFRALTELKKTAKGDGKVPADRRVYLHVEASADTTIAKHPSGDFFYDKAWSVGRVLDVAAKALQVQNMNNRIEGEEERLRVFHVEAGRLLEFGEKMGDVCQNGNTIVLLRGVGPPVPDLIQP